MGRAVWVLVLCAACRLNFDAVADAPSADDAEVVDAPALGPWANITPVTGLAQGGSAEQDPALSSSQLEMLFVDGTQLYTVTRTTTASSWSPRQMAPFSMGQEGEPRFSPDDLTLYFGSSRSGGLGMRDVWSVTRPAVGMPWGIPANLAEVNTGTGERWFAPCNGGRYVVVRGPTGSDDLYEGVLGGAPETALTAINSTGMDSGPFLSNDCLTLHFFSTRGGADRDLYVSTRASTGTAWNAPVSVAEINSSSDDEDPWLSPDGRVLMFASNRAGNTDIYTAMR